MEQIQAIELLAAIIISIASYLGYACGKGRTRRLIKTVIEAASDKKITPRELYEIGRQVLLAFGYKIRYVRPPKIYETVSGEWLQKHLRSNLGEIKDLRLADTEYAVTTKEELMAFLKADLTNLREYQPEIFDCDDFTLPYNTAAKSSIAMILQRYCTVT